MGKESLEIDFRFSCLFVFSKAKNKRMRRGTYSDYMSELPTHLFEDYWKTLLIQQWKNLTISNDFVNIGEKDGITEIPEEGTDLVKKSSIHRSLKQTFQTIPGSPIGLLGEWNN